MRPRGELRAQGRGEAGGFIGMRELERILELTRRNGARVTATTVCVTRRVKGGAVINGTGGNLLQLRNSEEHLEQEQRGGFHKGGITFKYLDDYFIAYGE